MLPVLRSGPEDVMAKIFEEIDDTLAAFIGEQKMFFIATAPLAARCW